MIIDLLSDIYFSIKKDSNCHNIFICHGWEYHQEYVALIELLYSGKDLYWNNSSTLNFKYTNSNLVLNEYLNNLLYDQVCQSDCIIVIYELYQTHKFWIQKQLEIAEKYNIPIIVLKQSSMVSFSKDLLKYNFQVCQWDVNDIQVTINKVKESYIEK